MLLNSKNVRKKNKNLGRSAVPSVITWKSGKQLFVKTKNNVSLNRRRQWLTQFHLPPPKKGEKNKTFILTKTKFLYTSHDTFTKLVSLLVTFKKCFIIFFSL